MQGENPFLWSCESQGFLDCETKTIQNINYNPKQTNLKPMPYYIV
jgi:hypothetical protein